MRAAVALAVLACILGSLATATAEEVSDAYSEARTNTVIVP